MKKYLLFLLLFIPLCYAIDLYDYDGDVCQKGSFLKINTRGEWDCIYDSNICYLNQDNIFTGINYFNSICLNNTCITSWNLTEMNITVSGGGNTSWNETYANTLYYPLNTNPYSYYNASNLDLSSLYSKPEVDGLITGNISFHESDFKHGNTTDEIALALENSTIARLGYNPFDQGLNTTENVTFGKITTKYHMFNDTHGIIINESSDIIIGYIGDLI